MRNFIDHTIKSEGRGLDNIFTIEEMLSGFKSVAEYLESEGSAALLDVLKNTHDTEIKALDLDWFEQLQLYSLKYGRPAGELAAVEGKSIMFRDIRLASATAANREKLGAADAVGGEAEAMDYIKTYDGVHRYLGTTHLGNMARDYMKLRNISIRNGNIEIEGAIGFKYTSEVDKIDVYLTDEAGASVDCDIQISNRISVKDDGSTMKWVAYRILVPAPQSGERRFRIAAEMDGILVEARGFKYDVLCPISDKFKKAYFYEDGYAVTLSDGALVVAACTEEERSALEERFCEELAAKGYAEEVALRRAALELRQEKKRENKRIFLVSDRIRIADDNGEAFFRYLNENKNENKIEGIDSYFVIERDSEDGRRIAEIGSVVEPKSELHRALVLACDVMIATHFREALRLPFIEKIDCVRDLNHHKFVMIEHGSSHGKDFANWFNRTIRMMDGLVVMGRPEVAAFGQEKYGFRPEEIWDCGLPRYDYLENNPKKIITVAPTWKKELTKGMNQETGLWDPIDDFGQSAHAKFFSSLMTNEKLNAAAASFGYSIRFKPHPNFAGRETSYGFDESVYIYDSSVKYKSVFAESSLLITDFSSVVYDFAYLGKPVMFLQNRAEIPDFKRHAYAYEDGFTYEKDGIGEVFYDVDSAVDCIIEYMKNDCKMKEEYARRVDDFFCHRDRNNCQRVLERII